MNFSQKFEPEAGKVLHGAGQSPETFKKYWDAVEDYKPIIYMTYIKFQSLDIWIGKIKKEINNYPDIMVQIGLNLRIDQIDRTQEISLGEYDKELRKLAEAIKKIKNPVFIRIGYEFDQPKKYKPKRYVSCFKYIVDYFKNLGVDNFASVWCSAPYSGTETFEPYYPGDEYVDWFGIDLFDTRFFANNEYVPTKNFLKMAKQHKKPVMIGESSAIKIGIENTEKIWDEWFKPYFKLIDDNPEIKAFCYINYDWGKDWKTPRWMNCRIEENEEIRKRYVKNISNPKFIHNKLK